MIQEIIGIFKDAFLRHKGVRTFKYQADALNNAQPDYRNYQVYCDDVNYHNLNITTNIFVQEYTFRILGSPKATKDIIQVQDEAYTIAVDVLGLLDYKPQYKGIIALHDYSITTVAHYTDNDSAGVVLTVSLETPSPLDLCDLDSNFNDEPYEDKKDKDIDIEEKEEGEITLNPIKLPIDAPKC